MVRDAAATRPETAPVPFSDLTPDPSRELLPSSRVVEVVSLESIGLHLGCCSCGHGEFDVGGVRQ